MNIQPISQNSFKGYDARPLKGVLLPSCLDGIKDEMVNIGKKENFKVFPLNNTEKIWAQDLWTILKDSILTHSVDMESEAIRKYLNGLKYNFTQKIIRGIELNKFMKVPKDKVQLMLITDNPEENAHISGGNLFLVNNGSKDEVLVGENELKRGTLDHTDIMGMYGVDKITVLPQMDFHLDLFIRPLDKKNILITDDQMTLNVLHNIHNTLLKNPRKYSDAIKRTYTVIQNFKQAIDNNPYKQTNAVDTALKNAGYNTVRVPGRIYDVLQDDIGLRHYCNFMYPNVLKNKRGNIVYITNKSDIDSILGLTPEIIKETGCSFENAFIKSISRYVGKNHTYFIEGKDDYTIQDLLYNYQGGIHCICSEVPFNDKNPEN